MKRIVLCASIVFLSIELFLIPLPLLAVSAESPFSVDSIVFARRIESREPVDFSEEFESAVDRVFCWTKLSTKTPPIKVKHVWYKAGQKLLEVPLTVDYSSGRYWSVKNVGTGDWTVEVVGPNGEVFGSGSFKVK